VLNYIDLALSGAYAGQQDFYRRGLAALDGYCRMVRSGVISAQRANQKLRWYSAY
jgi:hypothetical protein